MRNLITDVPGLSVGHATDDSLHSGVTAIVFDHPSMASVSVCGGAPGTRETDLLQPGRLVEKVDAIVFSGGSAFGLSAADGVMAYLRERQRGYEVRDVRVPIVPAAILFDLHGMTDWGRYPPYRELGYDAAQSAARDFDLGSTGAGTGATTACGKGGIGSCSALSSSGHIVGALAAVNAFGSAHFTGSRHFLAGAHEQGDEFGGYGAPSSVTDTMRQPLTKANRGRENTTLCLVATDAMLSRDQCHMLAQHAQKGMKMALAPVHTLYDGDVVFAAATGVHIEPVDDNALMKIGQCAAITLARAIARGVYESQKN